MRVKINLKCTSCGRVNYISSKNKANNQEKIVTKKYCPNERKVTIHREI